MSTWHWICLAFIAYWVGVLLWIKGTDPMANGVWHVIWAIVRIPLMLCGGFILFGIIIGASSRR